MRKREGRVAIGAVVWCVLLASAIPATASAKVVRKSARVVAKLSVTTAADGTIRANAILKSSESHCLSRALFDQRHPGDGYYHVIGGLLEYGEQVRDPLGGQRYQNTLRGLYGADGNANPPRDGWLSPVSPFGRSPLRWQAVWPGSARTNVEDSINEPPPSYSRTYDSTVGEASWVVIYPSVGGQVKYRQNGNKVKLHCKAVLKGGIQRDRGRIFPVGA